MTEYYNTCTDLNQTEVKVLKSALAFYASCKENEELVKVAESITSKLKVMEEECNIYHRQVNFGMGSPRFLSFSENYGSVHDAMDWAVSKGLSITQAQKLHKKVFSPGIHMSDYRRLFIQEVEFFIDF